MDEPVITESPPLVNEDMSFAENWTQPMVDTGAISAEDVATLSRYKTLPDMAKGLMEHKRKLGKDPSTLVEIPNEHSTEEVKNTFLQRALGVEDEEKYTFELDDEIKNVIGEPDAGQMEKAKKFIRERMNASPEKYREAMDFYFKLRADEIGVNLEKIATQRELDRQNGLARLKEKFGDALEEHVMLADQMTLKYGMREWIAERELENDPKLTEILATIGADLTEGRSKGLFAKPTTATPDQITAKISEIRNNPDYNDRTSPNYKALQKQMEDLYKQKYNAKG